MRTFNLSLAAVAALSLFTTAQADTLAEALSNGKVSGEVTVTYENRSQDKEINPYYSNTAYSTGSLGLTYETGSFNNFSAVVGVRAYNVLFEDDDNFATDHGKGDASERFYQDGKNRTVDLEKAYIEYAGSSVKVRAGRQFISTDWVNKTHDALRVQSNFDNTALDFIWSQRQGRIYSRDYRPMTNTNDDKGIYKASLTQKISENLSLTGYYFSAPDVHDIYGGKFNTKVGPVSLMAHYANQSADIAANDSDILHVTAAGSLAGVASTLGYIQTSDEAGFNNTKGGETINPFEEGDQLYLQNAKTTYLMLSKGFGDVSLTGLYGITSYDKSAVNYEKAEFNVWAGYTINKNTSLSLGYAITDEDSKDTATTDLSQINLTLAYKF